jgi:hypothetical protein
MMEAKKRKPYKPRSLKGAEVYVRNLRFQLSEMERYDRWKSHALNMLAKLAAEGPSFSNPLDVYEAKKIRDQILDSLGLTPEGRPKV